MQEQALEEKEYVVRIPAYEITVSAKDELEAYEKAVQEIRYYDMKISIVG